MRRHRCNAARDPRDSITSHNACFLADDVALPQRFEKQVTYLRQHPDCVVVGTDAMQVDAAGWPLGRLRVPLTHEEIEAFLLEGRGEALCHPAAMPWFLT